MPLQTPASLKSVPFPPKYARSQRRCKPRVISITDLEFGELRPNVNLSKTPRNVSDNLAPAPRCFSICYFPPGLRRTGSYFLVERLLNNPGQRKTKETTKSPVTIRILVIQNRKITSSFQLYLVEKET